MLADSTQLPDRYKGVAELGSGAMGTVFKARDTRLKRFVAIKILKKGTLDASKIQRFQREARAAGRLSHNSLVTVYDFGVTENGDPYLVMELVEGKTLSACIEEYERLSAEFVLAIAVQIARGMAYAHENGVVHRDLKSSNIVLFSDLTGEEKIKIIDFGISRLLSDDGEAGKLTATNAILGSPYYLSPEQAAGQDGDEVSDIYSLGCILYEALSGRVPYNGDSFLEVIKKKTESDPHPFSRVTSAEIPGALKRIVYRCLKRDPKERYQSMNDLLSDLELCKQVAFDETLILPPEEVSGSIRSADESGRRGTLFAMAATVIVGVIAIAGSVMYLWGVGDVDLSDEKVDVKTDSHVASDPYLMPGTDTVPAEVEIRPAEGDTLYVKVGHGKFDDEDLKKLAGKPISALCINGRDVSDEGMPAIAEFPLASLEIGDTKISGRSLGLLNKVGTLTEIKLRGSAVTNEDLKSIKDLPLERLRLTYCKGLNDESIRIIKKQWPGIRSLHLAGTRLGEQGFKDLRDLKEVYDLDVTLTESGLEQISQMKSLTYLTISGTKVTAEMIRKLATMKKLKTIKFVACKKVTKVELSYLKTRMPDCRVEAKYSGIE